MFNCECGAELIQDDCESILDVCQEAPVVKDYETLANKPQINGVTLDGNKTSEDLGITQEIADEVIAEATLRENADTALGGRINDEATARENADTTLGGRIDGEITNRTNADNALGTRIDNEILARQGGDNNLQTQIDAITSKSDVVDVVADYAALQAYDTQHLGNNDVIKVLDDETHEDAQTYYRWNKTAGTWSYIGSEAPYYSKGQMDTMLQAKQDKLIAGTNIQIAQDGKTISATDTTYTAGNGLNLNGTEFSADTTVLATKSDLDSFYTKTETDTKLAPKLEAEVVAELPSTGTEGKLYLTPKNYTTGTATGNPITISLGEDAGQITSFQLDGDTFQQSYTGKNIFATGDFDYTNGGIRSIGSNGVINSSGTLNQAWGFNIYGGKNLIPSGIIPAGTYTVSITKAVAFPFILGLVAEDNTTTIGNYTIPAGSTSYTFTTDQPAKYFTLWSNYANHSGEQISVTGLSIMIESGSSASPFEPFVGGQASPNPAFPQQIQTVTGLQTVSINGTDYPIDLGSIELCKLGDYQDYIWKDGDVWKVHKATGNTTYDGSNDEIWTKSNSTANQLFIGRADGMSKDGGITVVAKSDKFTYIDRAIIYAQSKIGFTTQTTGDGYAAIRVGLGLDSTVTTVASFRSWLSENITTAYYPLETPTDTTITDQTLIAQLEAIRTASLQASNTITNTATGSNLAGDMELGYYEYDPTNRYDKWLWLDLNNNYEKLGS